MEAGKISQVVRELCLDGIFERCQGAYAERTLSGYRNDLEQFQSWSEARHKAWLPASPATVAAFIDEETKCKALSTVKRRVEAVKFAHRMLDLPSPVANSEVKLALRRAMRSNRARPKQSHGLTHEILRRILDACPDSLAGKRDAAIICVGYDSLARSYELSLLEVEHVSSACSTILIPRSKTDQSGEGRLAYLAPRTQEILMEWLDASGITGGPLFQSLHTRKLSGQPLSTSAIRRLVKRAGMRADDDGEAVKLSGHSMRVGAAQDMMTAGLDHLAIMQAGGWKTLDVVARYVENAAAQNLHRRRWASLSS
ncbi:MAG: tyrosine-type recombinase/integrase [Porphyrobacter sp.]|nr:tyrosine-type recombinase/integrase [Porphyrobacter sp.]